MRYALTDAEWRLIEPTLPRPGPMPTTTSIRSLDRRRKLARIPVIPRSIVKGSPS